MNGKILLKRVISSLCAATGVLSLAERMSFSRNALVLMYHRILEEPLKQPFFVQEGMFVKASNFDKQLEFLKGRFKLVFLDELVDKIQCGGNIGGLCAITFDDGWRDNYTEAFPLLKKHGVPATVFLATGYVGTDRFFWPEEISLFLEKFNHGQSGHEHLPPAMIRFLRERSTCQTKRRIIQPDWCIDILKGLPLLERTEILEFFRGHFRLATIPRQMMDWEEARMMLSSGLVRFGAHTVSHEMLDQVSLQKAQHEIETSKADIEYHLGCRVRTFAYPNGNLTDDICRILEGSGFSGAVTTRKGLLAPVTPLMKMPRVAIHDDVSSTVPMLRSRMLCRRF